MDQKYIDEIRALEQAATPGPWYASASDYNVPMLLDCNRRALLRAPKGTANAAFIAHSRTDIPTLLNQHDQDQQQIATLKKALEIASTEANRLFSQLETFEIIKVDRKASCAQDNIDVWIHQAQEQEGKK